MRTTVALALLATLGACVHRPPTTVYVVRHAEKGEGKDPDLTGLGLMRAAALRDLLRSVPLDAVIVTDLCRTAQTGQPSATAHDLGLTVLPVTGAEDALTACMPPVERKPAFLPSADDHARAVARAALAHPGGTVLVAGHSNTVPAILEALGAPPPCPPLELDDEGRCWLPHDGFDDLFVVTVGGTRADWARLRYGARSD